MFKMTDAAAFVERTAYRPFPQGTLTAAFRCRDELTGTEQCLRIAFAGGRWAVAAPDAVPEVTVTCPQGDGTAAALGAEAVAQRGLLRRKTAKGRGRR